MVSAIPFFIHKEENHRIERISECPKQDKRDDSGKCIQPSDTYKQIENLVLQKYFPGFYHDYKQNLRTTASLNEQLKEATDHNNVLEAENKQLKAELETLSSSPQT